MSLLVRLRHVAERVHFDVLVGSALMSLLVLGAAETLTSRGAVEQGWQWLGWQWLVLPWAAAGVLAPAGVFVAAIEGVFLWMLWGVSRGFRERVEIVKERLRSDPTVLVGAHTQVSRALLGGAALLACCWLCAPLLNRIQDDTLRRYMLLYVVCAGVSAGVVTAYFSERPWTWVWRWVDKRFGLPRPRSGFVRAALLCAPPAVAATFLLLRYSDVLGVALVPTSMLAILLFQIPSAVLIRRVLSRHRRVLVVSLVAATVTGPVLLDLSSEVSRALARQNVTGSVLDVLRRATDIDGDGVSGTFGGGDCEPTNPDVSPLRQELPGNGVDEDCDGRDGQHATGAQRIFSGSLSPDAVQPYNVVWILVDTLRVDRMSVYGASRKTTPFLERFAKSAVMFDNAYAQGTTTHLSIPSMFTGRDVASIRWHYDLSKTRVELDPAETTLARVLAKEGYATHAVVGDHLYRLKSITRGFQHVVHSATKGGAKTTHTKLQKTLREVMPSKQPFFLLAYYADPHKPYDAHGNSFGRGDQDRYDAEVLHVDGYLEKLINALKKNKRVWSRTIVVVSSDHGEEFREHGKTGHGDSCHEETMHVPLLLRVPGFEAQRVSNIVASTDIVPTILELTGTAADGLDLTGQSLLLPIAGQASDDRMVSCVATKQGSTRGRPYFRFATRSAGMFAQEERFSATIEVFDTKQDPAETRDVWEERKESAEFLGLREFSKRIETGNLWELVSD